MNMTVTIASGATPTNDAFANAIAILDPSAPSTDPTLDINRPARSVDGTTTGATIEAGEPVHGAGPRSVWYSFTPQRTGTLKFAVTDPTGALIPSTNVELYTGSAVGGLTTWSYGPTASLRQQLILSGGVGYIGVARGVPYSIAVSAGSTTGSGFTLKLNYFHGFADNFQTALFEPDSDFDRDPATTFSLATNYLTTTESTEPAHSGQPARHSIWRRFHARPTGGSVTFAFTRYDETATPPSPGPVKMRKRVSS